jgi:hypothetical protein
MSCKYAMICVGIMITAIVIAISLKRNVHIDENYEPQDMGTRKYWGFGRDYGYSYDDTGQQDNFCYISSPEFLCVQGYEKVVNSRTKREECCVNAYNY